MSSMSLGQEQCEWLESLREDFKISQHEIAKSGGIPQASVSNCLRGQALNSDSLNRFFTGLCECVHVSSGLKSDGTAEVMAELDAMRKSLGLAGEDCVSIPRPGAVSESNRVVRVDVEKVLSRALSEAPFTAAVVGSPESGKTTLLQVLTSKARRIGFKVVEFDVRLLEPPEFREKDEGSEESLACFFCELAMEVGTTLEASLEKAKAVDGRLAFSRYLRQLRAKVSEPPLLIVCDHASVSRGVLEELAQTCRSLDAYKGRTQVSWALDVSGNPGSHRVGAVSKLAPSPMIELGWFSGRQVEDLADLYELREKEARAELWRWFKGHPFLTHSALHRYRDFCENTLIEDSWAAVGAEITASPPGGPFKQHLSRLKGRVGEELKAAKPLAELQALGEQAAGEQRDLLPLCVRQYLLPHLDSGLAGLPEFYIHQEGFLRS